jgi:hypothetical protein
MREEDWGIRVSGIGASGIGVSGIGVSGIGDRGRFSHGSFKILKKDRALSFQFFRISFKSLQKVPALFLSMLLARQLILQTRLREIEATPDCVCPLTNYKRVKFTI